MFQTDLLRELRLNQHLSSRPPQSWSGCVIVATRNHTESSSKAHLSTGEADDADVLDGHRPQLRVAALTHCQLSVLGNERRDEVGDRGRFLRVVERG